MPVLARSSAALTDRQFQAPHMPVGPSTLTISGLDLPPSLRIPQVMNAPHGFYGGHTVVVIDQWGLQHIGTDVMRVQTGPAQGSFTTTTVVHPVDPAEEQKRKAAERRAKHSRALAELQNRLAALLQIAITA